MQSASGEGERPSQCLLSRSQVKEDMSLGRGTWALMRSLGLVPGEGKVVS